MSIRSHIKNIGIILGSCFLLILAILWRQQIVTQNRQAKIISVLSEWAENGKPVIVEKIQKENVNVYKKFTVQSAQGSEYQGYVTKNILNKVKLGQQVEVLLSNEKRFGEISFVADEIDARSGMYIVRVKFDELLPKMTDFPVYKVLVEVFQDAICIPTEILKEVDGKYFVWTVDQEKKAHERMITVKSKNGFGAIVETGLEVGDLLIIEGYTMLKENDRVNILSQEEVR